MKKTILFLIILISFNCRSFQKVSEKKSVENVVSEKNVKEYYKTGELKATGPVEEELNEYNNFRKGFWKEFYKNGKMKEAGNFKLETYTNCCTSGLCEIHYSYKYGEWSYFYENGKLKAKGVYRLEKKHKKTSCEGGTEINYGNIDNSWEFFDKEGNKIKPTEKIILEIKIK